MALEVFRAIYESIRNVVLWVAVLAVCDAAAASAVDSRRLGAWRARAGVGCGAGCGDGGTAGAGATRDQSRVPPRVCGEARCPRWWRKRKGHSGGCCDAAFFGQDIFFGDCDSHVSSPAV